MIRSREDPQVSTCIIPRRSALVELPLANLLHDPARAVVLLVTHDDDLASDFLDGRGFGHAPLGIVGALGVEPGLERLDEGVCRLLREGANVVHAGQAS